MSVAASTPSARLRALRDKVCDCRIAAGESQRIVSPSGGRQSWLLDLRRLLLDADALSTIAVEFWDRFQAYVPMQIGAMESAAIPLLTAIILEARDRGLEINAFIVRKERKKSGLGRWIEGNLNNHPIVMVDDLLNSGETLDRARRLCAAQGKWISEIFVVVDYHSALGQVWRQKHRVKVSSLFDAQSIGLSIPEAHRRKEPLVQYLPLWDFRPSGGNPFFMNPKSAPLLVANHLYYGTDMARLWCLDVKTGRPVWQFEAQGALRKKGIWSSPCAYGGRLFFGAYNGCLYCLDTKTGSLIWHVSACEWIGSSPCLVPENRSLVVGLEYERPQSSGSIAAFSIDTGAKLWEHWLDNYQHGSSTFWPESGIIISGTNDHSVLAMKANTGEVIWEYKTLRSVKYAPAVDQERDLAVFASSGGMIYVVRASTGERLLEVQTDGVCYTTPLVVGNRVLCGSADRHLYIIDTDEMRLVKRLHAGARIFASPSKIGSNMIIGACSGKVFELDINNFSIQAEFHVDDAVTNAIAVSQDFREVFVSTYMNSIHAFTRVPV